MQQLRIALGQLCHAIEHFPTKYESHVGRLSRDLRLPVTRLQNQIPHVLQVMVTGEASAGGSPLVSAMTGVTITNRAVTSNSTVYLQSPKESLSRVRRRGETRTLLDLVNGLTATLEREYRQRMHEPSTFYEALTPLRCFHVPEAEERYREGLADKVPIAVMDVGRHYGEIPPALQLHLEDSSVWSVVVVVLTPKSSSDRHMITYLDQLSRAERKPLGFIFVVLQPLPEEQREQLIAWLKGFHFPHPDILPVTIRSHAEGLEIPPDDLRALEARITTCIEPQMTGMMEPLREVITQALEDVGLRITEMDRAVKRWEFAQGLETSLHNLWQSIQEWNFPCEDLVRRPGGPFSTAEEARDVSRACAKKTQDWFRTEVPYHVGRQGDVLMDQLALIYQQLVNIPTHIFGDRPPLHAGSVTEPGTSKELFHVNIALRQWYLPLDTTAGRKVLPGGTEQYHVAESFKTCFETLYRSVLERGQRHLTKRLNNHFMIWGADLTEMYKLNLPQDALEDQGYSSLLECLELLFPDIPSESEIQERKQALERLVKFQVDLETTRDSEDYPNLIEALDSMVRLEESEVEPQHEEEQQQHEEHEEQ